VVEAAGVADEPRDTIRVSAAAACSRSTGDREPYLRPATRQIHSVSVHIWELKGEDAAALVERRMKTGMRGTVFESEMTVSGGKPKRTFELRRILAGTGPAGLVRWLRVSRRSSKVVSRLRHEGFGLYLCQKATQPSSKFCCIAASAPSESRRLTAS